MKKLLLILLCLPLLFSTCKKEDAEPTNTGNNNNNNSALSIGDMHQGGIVFYLDGNGGGLIAAPSDQSQGADWGCEGSLIGADGTAIGTGNQNTIDIEAGCTTSGTAADFCANLTLGGYSDWFLPSKDELYRMYVNKAAIGGSWHMYYWNSKEDGVNGAWRQSFYDGTRLTGIKYGQNNVRAVRAF